MPSVLHLPARAGALIACDMTTARDTPAERLAKYRELFARALLRREQACCPLLDYRVETADGNVIYMITGDERASVDTVLDAIHDLPDEAGPVERARLDFVGDVRGAQ